jgi:arabinan endo-1,5-alpha-L-arabinosidase
LAEPVAQSPMAKPHRRGGGFPFLGVALSAALCAAGCSEPPAPVSSSPIVALEGNVEGVHDPALAAELDSYYVVSTDTGPPRNLPLRRSRDLRQWELIGTVFDAIPEWIRAEIPGITDLWAPDVSHFRDKFHLYYSASTFGLNRSIIALATTRTLDPASPDYEWVDGGKVIESHLEDDWNAIDPNILLDEDGTVWMSFGSFWSGIKLRRIDSATGLPSNEDPTLYSLASRPRAAPYFGAVEAPFLIRRGVYYYLFVSFDQCCRGAESTYNIRFGRATEVTGPYRDKGGIPLLEGGGSLVLGSGAKWKGPGGQSVFRDAAGDYLVFHAYEAATGRPSLHIRRINWEDGWPIVSPLE